MESKEIMNKVDELIELLNQYRKSYGEERYEKLKKEILDIIEGK